MPYRYIIVGITALAALWLYIDRICFSTLAEPIKIDLLLPHAPEPSEADELSPEYVEAAEKKKLEENPEPGSKIGLTADEIAALKKKQWADNRMSYVLGAFFFTYALFQIPIGVLADRFGPRLVLAVSIVAWSLVTAATGLVQSFAALLAIRLMLGVTESGAYPGAAALIKNWAKPEQRGLFSSIVALGGRIGGVLAPLLTAWLAISMAGIGPSSWMGNPAGVNWRGVFVLYGLCGLTVALAFWIIVRDRPDGQKAAPATGTGVEAKAVVRVGVAAALGVVYVPVAALVRQVWRLAVYRNMWYFGALQFGVNLGWAFLVTLFPTYLKEVFAVPLDRIGLMQTVTLFIGMVGMLIGGLVTDAVRAWLGPRYGRSIPIGVALSGCAIALFLVPAVSSVWVVVALLGAMAFLVDMHNPSIWSFAQDVGGRNVGAALGFGNMWGNFGAALSPVLLMAVKNAAGWDVVFIVGGSAFAVSAVCGLLLDATRPVDSESPS